MALPSGRAGSSSPPVLRRSFQTIPGLLGTPHLTNETVFDLAECPHHLIIIGAGAVGLELAQAFRRLGSDVTVLETATPLASDDPECAAVVLDALVRDGVELGTGIEIAKVGRVLAKVKVVFATPAGAKTIEGSHLLIAAGRRPNIEDVDLAPPASAPRRVASSSTARCAPPTSALRGRRRHRRTRVSARRQSPRRSGDAPRAVARTVQGRLSCRTLGNLYRSRIGPSRPSRAGGPSSKRCHARLALALRENDRAQVERATDGHVKIVTDRAGEILHVRDNDQRRCRRRTRHHLRTLAISQKLNMQSLAALSSPTRPIPRVGKRAAMTYFIHGLTMPRTRRIMGWLRRFGWIG